MGKLYVGTQAEIICAALLLFKCMNRTLCYLLSKCEKNKCKKKKENNRKKKRKKKMMKKDKRKQKINLQKKNKIMN